MKLYVDDMRPFPRDEDFICCRTYEDAIWELSVHDFEYVSLDYHLGYCESGLDILIWMKNNGKAPPKINIHSTHVWGRREMKEFCEQNFPDSEITMNYPY